MDKQFAFTVIGAIKTAQICNRALGAFGGKLPADYDEQQALLDTLQSDKTDKILEKCDNEFLKYEDDLTALNHAPSE